MPEKTILHVRDYVFPKIDLPTQATTGYRILTADTPREALEIIKDTKEIAAYVLGMAMPRQSHSVGSINAVFREKEALRYAVEGQQETAEKRQARIENHRRLIRQGYSMLNPNAGFELYQEIRQGGDASPILFWSSRSLKEMRGMVPLEDRAASILTMPELSSKIHNWFTRCAPPSD